MTLSYMIYQCKLDTVGVLTRGKGLDTVATRSELTTLSARVPPSTALPLKLQHFRLQRFNKSRSSERCARLDIESLFSTATRVIVTPRSNYRVRRNAKNGRRVDFAFILRSYDKSKENTLVVNITPASCQNSLANTVLYPVAKGTVVARSHFPSMSWSSEISIFDSMVQLVHIRASFAIGVPC